MNDDKFELVRGSGNVYRDFGHANAGLEQARAITAALASSMLMPSSQREWTRVPGPV